jgi:hypothetical protein
MTRLEHIIEETRSLSRADRLRLRQVLDMELLREPGQELAGPICSQRDDEQIRQERLEWLKSHREEYAGQYVALDGVVLVGHGGTIREAHEQASQNGVDNPFLVRLTSESDGLFAGW